MTFMSTLYDSVNRSINETFSDDPFFDTSHCQGGLSAIQKLTMDVALLTLFFAGCALVVVGAAYLEHAFVTLITFGYFTTARAGLVVLLSPYLLSAAKTMALFAAGLGLLWTAETLFKAGIDLA